MAPSTARGNGSRAGAKGTASRTVRPVIAPDHSVRPPARRLRELRENDPPTGNAPEMPEARLATPWLTSSRLASHGMRSAVAKVRAIEAGSANPTRAITMPGTISDPASPYGRPRSMLMKPPGRSPITEPE